MRLFNRFALLCLLPLVLGATAPPRPSSQAVLASAFWTLAMEVADVPPDAELSPEYASASMVRMEALLAAARQLDAEEIRYPLLAARVSRRLGERDLLMDAVTAVRRLRPEDRFIQVELVRLYASGMQTVQARLEYLNSRLALEAIPAEVRSVIATDAADLLMESRRQTEAAQMLEQALKLNPLNSQALLRKYSLMGPTTAPAERAALLLQMLRANPANPVAIEELGDLMAGAGLVGQSLEWYELAANVRMAGGMPARETILKLAAQRIVAGQIEGATSIIDQVLKVQPHDYAFLLLRALALRAADPPAEARAIEAAVTEARNAMINSLEVTRQELGVKTATTRPIEGALRELPDLSGDIELLRGAENPATVRRYAAVLEDLAWVEVALAGRAADAEKIRRHLWEVRGADPANHEAAVADARLAGWAMLVEGRHEQARARLEPVAAEDPLARLGLLRTYSDSSEDREAWKKEAAALLASHGHGFIGALLMDELRPRGMSVSAAPWARQLTSELERFNRDWLRILTEPSRFYAVRVEPLRVSHVHGQSMLVRLTIQNISAYDLSIGPDGVIGTDVWINVQLTGLRQANLPGATVHEITEQMVLRPRQSLSAVVRIDHGPLAGILAEEPVAPVTLLVAAVTNPLTRLCGQVSEARRMERIGFQVGPGSSDMENLLKPVADGAEQMRRLGLATDLSRYLSRSPTQQAQAKELNRLVQEAAQAADANVRTWARFLLARWGPSDQASDRIQQMLEDGEWPARLLGLVALGRLPVETQRDLAWKLSKDPQAFIQRYARSLVEHPVRAVSRSATSADQPPVR
jgi:tetratricopeptide (TPR) repeat protein